MGHGVWEDDKGEVGRLTTGEEEEERV